MVGIDIKGMVDWLKAVGALGTVVLFLVGFQQRWWIFPRELDAANAAWQVRLEEITRDRDEWKQRALVAMATGERQQRAADTLLPLTGPAPP